MRQDKDSKRANEALDSHSQELLVNIIEVDQKVGIELMPIVNEDLGVELMSPDRGILNKLLNIRV